MATTPYLSMVAADYTLIKGNLLCSSTAFMHDLMHKQTAAAQQSSSRTGTAQSSSTEQQHHDPDPGV
jgi:hypothetical protein